MYAWRKSQREGRNISRRKFNENIGTPHLAPTQFCLLPGSHRITWFLYVAPFSLQRPSIHIIKFSKLITWFLHNTVQNALKKLKSMILVCTEHTVDKNTIDAPKCDFFCFSIRLIIFLYCSLFIYYSSDFAMAKLIAIAFKSKERSKEIIPKM